MTNEHKDLPALYRKTALVSAEQFLPDEGKIPKGVFSDGNGDPRKSHNYSFVLNTKEGRHELRYGDYVCTGPAGEQWNVERSIFEATYELAARPEPAGAGVGFNMHAHLARQAAFSLKTFGPGARTLGVCDHIRKELLEIEADPLDLREWVDVVILALDGAWRCGGSPEQIIDGIVAKQTKNEGRNWPNWRTADPTKAIEHDRSSEAAPQAQQPVASGDCEYLRSPGTACNKCGKVHGDAPAPDAGARDAFAQFEVLRKIPKVPGYCCGTKHTEYEAFELAIRTLKTTPSKPAQDLVAAIPQLVTLPPDPETPLNTLLMQIEAAFADYERFGATCTFESQPMIHASTLEEIAEQAVLVAAHLKGGK